MDLNAIQTHKQGLALDYEEYLQCLSSPNSKTLTWEFFERFSDSRFAEWEAAAAEGQPLGMILVGECFALGIGVTKNERLGYEMFLAAAELGEAVAQFRLYTCMQSGEGVTKNERKALEWLRLAAEQGLPVAECSMGITYYLGEVVPQDSAKAAAWYERAGQHGNLDACEFLGHCYESGDGVKKDAKKSFQWFMKAAEQGSKVMPVIGGPFLQVRRWSKQRHDRGSQMVPNGSKTRL